MPSILSNTNRNNLDIVAKGKYLPTIKDVFSIGLTFSLTVFAWIFFRAANVHDAYYYVREIFSMSIFTVPYFPGIGLTPPIIALTGVFILIEWIGREEQFAIARLGNTWYKPLRWSMYYGIIATIIWFVGKEQQFIYFQF